MSFDQFTSNTTTVSDSMSLVELIRWRAVHQPEQTAFTFLLDGESSDARITYSQLYQQAQTIAAALQRKIDVGDRAILLYQPGLEYIAAFVGCLYAGIIAVPAYVPLLHRPPVHLQAIVRDAQARLVLSTDIIHAYLQHLFPVVPELAHVDWLLTDVLMESDTASVHQIEAGNLISPISSIEGNTTAFLQYTSGSTGSPRGVMVSHANLLANLKLLCHYLVPPGENLGVTWLPPYHDMGLIGGILLALYSGTGVTLMSPLSFLQQPRRWLEAISRTKSAVSGGPNFAYDLCVRKIPPEQRAGLDLSSWQRAIIGAEPVRATTIAEFSKAFAQCGFRQEAFYPCYGLAEATLMVSCKQPMTPPVFQSFDAAGLERKQVIPITNESENAATSGSVRTLVSCGQALIGQQIEIVAPDSGKRCQPAEIGEIWAKGPSIARGYWNQPQKSAETFNAYLSDSGEGPFLRTGDSGFFHQGELYIAGRLKDLIIIRGRNHFPQDLELTAQNSHPFLRPGGGAAFSIEKDNEERLVIVHELVRLHQYHETELDKVIQAIRKAIWEGHELEVYAVVLISPGEILKTSSGKIQRSACRNAFLSGDFQSVKISTLESRTTEAVRSYAAPRTQSEELLADIWSEVLGVERERLSIYDGFFDLGGDSLSAVQVVSRIRDTFQLEPPPNCLFEAQTIADLSHYLEAAKLPSLNTPLPPIEPEAKTTKAFEARFPLSYAQERMWFFEQAVPGSTGSRDNIPIAARFKGKIDFTALLQSFKDILRRHDILRAVFTTENDHPYQIIRPYVDEGNDEFSANSIIDFIDLTARPKEEREEAVLNLLRKEQYHVFDLTTGPLLRIKIIRLAGNECALLLNMHHIISDSWSIGVLIEELSLLYEAFSREQPSLLPDLHIQYVDYALWQQRWMKGEVLTRQLMYWEKQLAGAPALLKLPTDHPRPPIRSYQGARYPFILSQSLSQKLVELSRREGVTLFMTLLAAFNVLLYLHSEQSDIVIGSFVANRTRTETEKLIGLFANPVALRTNMSNGDITFQELLKRVRATTLGAYAHQDAPFQHVVEQLHLQRDASCTTLFQVMLIMQNTPPSSLLKKLGEVAVRPLRDIWIEWDAELAPCDLELHMLEGVDGRLNGDLCYSTDLFEWSTIKKLMERFQNILEEAVMSPGRLVKDFD